MPELEEKTEQPQPTIAPKREVDAKAEEIRAKRTLPKKPGDVVTFSEMCDWLKILSPEMHERILLYVYRIEPVINRQLVDPQANNSIDVISDGFDRLTEENIVNNHGGGKYKIIVFDAGNKDLQRNGFFSANLSIPMLDCPPKLELREVEWDNPKNKGFKSWARAQRLIDENNMPTIEKKTDGTGGDKGDAMVQAMKLAMDFAAKMDDKQQAQLKRQLGAEDTLGKSIGDILLEKMKQDDPNKQLAAMVTLMQAMKASQPDPVKQTSELTTIMPLLIAMMDSGKQQTAVLVESMKSQMTLLVEIMKSGGGKETGDDTERLKNLLEIAKMMKGGGAPAEKTLTESLIEAGTTILPGVLNIVGNIMAMQAASRGIGGVQAPSPVAQTVSAAAQAQDEARRANGGQQTSPQNGLPAPMTQDQKIMALRQFAPLITKAMSDGKEGFEFGQDVENLFGAPAVAMMIKDGAEPLLSVARAIPEFWEPLVQTYGEPHLVNWVNMLVNYKVEMNKAIEAEEKEGEIVQ